MYLTRRTYVQTWEHTPPEQRYVITVARQDGTTIQPARIDYIEEQVGYWRKANAIHAWFVRECQDGKDECQKTMVPREKLVELLEAVKKVLAATETAPGKVLNGYTGGPDGTLLPSLEDGQIIPDPTVAEQLLPTRGGFFFGSTDYDQYYLQDLRETQEMLEAVLAEPEEGSFFYHASW
jgi:hypothetical protein